MCKVKFQRVSLNKTTLYGDKCLKSQNRSSTSISVEPPKQLAAKQTSFLFVERTISGIFHNFATNYEKKWA